jgi:methylated-DNA-[protein]-cysteine S-methyltransferase
MIATAERTISSPLGPLHLVAGESGLLGVLYEAARLPGPRAHPLLDAAEKQLAEYFAGRRRDFDVPLQPQGTRFQREVWEALRRIPFGEICSYLDVARAVGRPSAVRAVGMANAHNPIAIIVPCHRVIASSGALSGYAGGVPAKRWLLSHERGKEALLALAGSQPPVRSRERGEAVR